MINDVEIYVRHASVAAVVDWFVAHIGADTAQETLPNGLEVHMLAGAQRSARLVLQPWCGPDRSWVSAWLPQNQTVWTSSLECARLAARSFPEVLCDPGDDYPGIPPQSDLMLLVRQSGTEELIVLQAGGFETQQAAAEVEWR